MSTCAAGRSLSGMERLKTPLRSTVSAERLSSLAILYIHNNKDVVIDNVVLEFARLKERFSRNLHQVNRTENKNS